MRVIPGQPTADDMAAKQRTGRCFYPVGGIAAGFVVGWVLHLLPPGPAKHPEVLDAGGRLLMLVFGLVGWAVGVAMDGKNPHCGGSRRLDQAAREHLKGWLLVWIPALVVVTALLETERLDYYFPGVLLLLCMLVGEIGWGSPTEIFRIPARRGKA